MDDPSEQDRMVTEDTSPFDIPTNRRKKEKLERLQVEEQLEDLEHRSLKEYAREELENLYNDEFSVDNPPACFERHEQEVALTNLMRSVRTLFTDTETTEANDVREEIQQRGGASKVEQAKNILDVMATYDNLSEPYIAAITKDTDNADVRAYATETLAELRTEQSQSKSLTAALRDWWRGE